MNHDDWWWLETNQSRVDSGLLHWVLQAYIFCA